jgi:Holliday junction resolvase RusA-like endonuclease
MAQLAKAGSEHPRLAVRLDLHPPRHGRADVANYEKLVVDAVFGYLGLDDSLIDDLRIVRHWDVVQKPGKLVMTIREAT